MTQTILMAAAACCLFASALDWLRRGDYANAFTITAYGLGYIGLAVVFWRIP